MSTRDRVLPQLLTQIRAINAGGRGLIGVDGLDGAGKTVLAEEVVQLAAQDGLRPVASLSIDGFHHPRSVRYANGRGPESFYRDSYDYTAFKRSVVNVFKQGLPVVPAVWDVDADAAVSPAELDLPQDCVLLVDGIFLHRPELRELWDASIWVQVPFAVSVPRGNERLPGKHDPDPGSDSNHRYVGGQRLYFAQCSPWDLATWVLDNEDLANPTIKGILTQGHADCASRSSRRAHRLRSRLRRGTALRQPPFRRS